MLLTVFFFAAIRTCIVALGGVEVLFSHLLGGLALPLIYIWACPGNFMSTLTRSVIIFHSLTAPPITSIGRAMAHGDGNNEQQTTTRARMKTPAKHEAQDDASTSADLSSSKPRLRSSTNGPHQTQRPRTATRGDPEDMGEKDRNSDPDYEDDDAKKTRPKSRNPRNNKTTTAKGTASAANQGSKLADTLTKSTNSVDHTSLSDQSQPDLFPEREDKIRVLAEKVKKISQERRESRKESKDLRQEVVELKKKVKAYEAETASMRSDLNAYRAAHTRNAARHKSDIGDGVLIEKFAKIFAESKDFAAKFAMEKFSDAALVNLKDVFAKLTTSTSKPFATKELSRQAAAGKVKVEVILNALLNKLLCSEIFERPYSFLDQIGESKVEDAVNSLMQRAETSESHDTNW